MDFLYYNIIFGLSYYVLQGQLNFIQKFKKMSFDRKKYVVCNFVKSAILLILASRSLPILIKVLYEFPQTPYFTNVLEIKKLGTIYTALDSSSIFYNTKMSYTTLCHHIAVIIFYIFNLYDNYERNSICLLIMLYAIFSSFGFMVNFLLGFRFICNINRKYYKICFVSFLLTSLINWSIQFTYCWYNTYENIYINTYIFLLLFIIYDDIILLRWLKNKSYII